MLHTFSYKHMQMYLPRILNSRGGDEKRFRCTKYYIFIIIITANLKRFLLESLFAWRNLLSLAIFHDHEFLCQAAGPPERKRVSNADNRLETNPVYYQSFFGLTAASSGH